MNVGELKAELADVPDDWPVVMSADPEGNGYHELSDVEKCRWHSKWQEIKLFELTDELRDQGYDEEDVNMDLPPAIAMWP